MKLFFGIFFSLACPAQTTLEDFYARLMRFDKPYESFIHAVCGWPEQLISPTPPPCDARVGHIDDKQFAKAREAAKKLFELEDHH